MSNLIKPVLIETLTYSSANIVQETVADEKGGKSMYMKGIFIQGDVQNGNGRVYPSSEIHRAVQTLKKQISEGFPVLGEVDHPVNLRINLDRVSHVIVDMWMEGSNGYGKLKIIPTPMGNLVQTMLESGVKLGVSSRGSGDVNESTGKVSDFDIVTVDVVAQPSGPDCWPSPMYESLMNMSGGHKLYEMLGDKSAQKYVQKEVLKFINELKIKR